MDRSTATDLTCRELVELVTDYLEDELSPGERARFDAHLAECEGCRRYVEQMRTTIKLARDSAVPQKPTDTRALLVAFRDYKRR
jgi:anti-sigma factor RsiW